MIANAGRGIQAVPTDSKMKASQRPKSRRVARENQEDAKRTVVKYSNKEQDHQTFSVNLELREPSCECRLRPRARRGSFRSGLGLTGGLSVDAPPPLRLVPHVGASSG